MRKIKRSGHGRPWYDRLNSVWVFPVFVFLVLSILTVLKLNGSSIGVYPLINGAKDSNLIMGGPRGVRSDEWLVNTQMIVAQANSGYHRINPNIGLGQDMSLIVDVPYKEWSALFKPQNFSFFVLPLEYAFAFKWWLLLAGLILSVYLVMLEIFPRKLRRAILVSLLVGLSPFVFWWYQTITIMPLTYSFLLIFLTLRLLKAGSTKQRLGYSLATTYVLACFALILYPPFQIPCLIAVAVFLAGWILEAYPTKKQLLSLLNLWRWVVMILVITTTLVLSFYATRKDAIHTITNTVYPGTRVITSGGPSPLLSFSSFLSPNLQYDQKAASGYLVNQSEASNFLFIAPFLLLPSIYLIYKRYKGGHILWGLVLINTLILFFLARMYIITPSWVEPIYKIFFLSKVPNTRLLLGLGLAGVLQLVFLMRAYDEIKLSRREVQTLALGGGLASLVLMLIVGRYTIHHYPVFIASSFKVIVFSLWVALGVYLVLTKRFLLGLSLLVLFSLLSVYKVNPLYRGLSPLTNSPITQAVQAYPKDSKWVVLDDRLLINFPLMAGRHSLNGVEFYPQLQLWHQLDPTHKDEFVYNRFAHVVFTDDPAQSDTFFLKYADNFLVKFDSCNPFIKKYDTYVLSPNKLQQGCASLDKTIQLPNKQLYIYKLAG